MLRVTCVEVHSFVTKVLLRLPKYKQSQCRANTGNDIIRQETRSLFRAIHRHHGVRLLGLPP